MVRDIKYIVIALILVLSLSACGGGKSSSDEISENDEETEVAYIHLEGGSDNHRAWAQEDGTVEEFISASIIDDLPGALLLDATGGASGQGYGGVTSIYDEVNVACTFNPAATSNNSGITIVSGTPGSPPSTSGCSDLNKCILCTVTESGGDCSLSCDGVIPSNSVSAADSFDVELETNATFKTNAPDSTGALRLDWTNNKGVDGGWDEYDFNDATNGLNGGSSLNMTLCNGVSSDPEDEAGNFQIPQFKIEDDEPTLNSDAPITTIGQEDVWKKAYSWDSNIFDDASGSYVSPDQDGYRHCRIYQSLTATMNLTGAGTPDADIDLSRGSVTFNARLCDVTGCCPGPGEDPAVVCSAGAQTETECSDSTDNDGDTFVDCLDDDCDGVGTCEYATELSCTGGVDNDGDGDIDCADSDCSANVACTACTSSSDCTGLGGAEDLICYYGTCRKGEQIGVDMSGECVDVGDCTGDYDTCGPVDGGVDGATCDVKRCIDASVFFSVYTEQVTCENPPDADYMWEYTTPLPEYTDQPSCETASKVWYDGNCYEPADGGVCLTFDIEQCSAEPVSCSSTLAESGCSALLQGDCETSNYYEDDQGTTRNCEWTGSACETSEDICTPAGPPPGPQYSMQSNGYATPPSYSQSFDADQWPLELDYTHNKYCDTFDGDEMIRFKLNDQNQTGVTPDCGNSGSCIEISGSGDYGTKAAVAATITPSGISHIYNVDIKMQDMLAGFEALSMTQSGTAQMVYIRYGYGTYGGGSFENTTLNQLHKYTYVDYDMCEGTCDNDGICEFWNTETYENCPNDCLNSCHSGDGLCDASSGENPAYCLLNGGGDCSKDDLTGDICGDGTCEGSESYDNCPLPTGDCEQPELDEVEPNETTFQAGNNYGSDDLVTAANYGIGVNGSISSGSDVDIYRIVPTLSNTYSALAKINADDGSKTLTSVTLEALNITESVVDSNSGSSGVCVEWTATTSEHYVKVTNGSAGTYQLVIAESSCAALCSAESLDCDSTDSFTGADTISTVTNYFENIDYVGDADYFELSTFALTEYSISVYINDGYTLGNSGTNAAAAYVYDGDQDSITSDTDSQDFCVEFTTPSTANGGETTYFRITDNDNQDTGTYRIYARQGGCPEVECSDSLDDDSDGYIDCYDSDCVGDPSCDGVCVNSGGTKTGDMCSTYNGNESGCNNHIYDSGAYNIYDCFYSGGTCYESQNICALADGTSCTNDNECDSVLCDSGTSLCTSTCDTVAGQRDFGYACNCDADCSSENCSGGACAAPTTEISCTDGTDNDSYGDYDCADSDCSSDVACTGQDCNIGEELADCSIYNGDQNSCNGAYVSSGSTYNCIWISSQSYCQQNSASCTIAAFCGDATCDTGAPDYEDEDTCPADCTSYDGDDVCGPAEFGTADCPTNDSNTWGDRESLVNPDTDYFYSFSNASDGDYYEFTTTGSGLIAISYRNTTNIGWPRIELLDDVGAPTTPEPTLSKLYLEDPGDANHDTAACVDVPSAATYGAHVTDRMRDGDAGSGGGGIYSIFYIEGETCEYGWKLEDANDTRGTGHELANSNAGRLYWNDMEADETDYYKRTVASGETMTVQVLLGADGEDTTNNESFELTKVTLSFVDGDGVEISSCTDSGDGGSDGTCNATVYTVDGIAYGPCLSFNNQAPEATVHIKVDSRDSAAGDYGIRMQYGTSDPPSCATTFFGHPAGIPSDVLFPDPLDVIFDMTDWGSSGSGWLSMPGETDYISVSIGEDAQGTGVAAFYVSYNKGSLRAQLYTTDQDQSAPYEVVLDERIHDSHGGGITSYDDIPSNGDTIDIECLEGNDTDLDYYLELNDPDGRTTAYYSVSSAPITPMGKSCDWWFEGDADSDGDINFSDNCIFVSNADQSNTSDGDMAGDACDLCYTGGPYESGDPECDHGDGDVLTPETYATVLAWDSAGWDSGTHVAAIDRPDNGDDFSFSVTDGNEYLLVVRYDQGDFEDLTVVNTDWAEANKVIATVYSDADMENAEVSTGGGTSELTNTDDSDIDNYYQCAIFSATATGTYYMDIGDFNLEIGRYEILIVDDGATGTHTCAQLMDGTP